MKVFNKKHSLRSYSKRISNWKTVLISKTLLSIRINTKVIQSKWIIGMCQLMFMLDKNWYFRKSSGVLLVGSSVLFLL